MTLNATLPQLLRRNAEQHAGRSALREKDLESLYLSPAARNVLESTAAGQN